MVANVRGAGIGQIGRDIFDDGIEPIDWAPIFSKRVQPLVLMRDLPVSGVCPEVNQRMPVSALTSSAKV